MRLVMLVLFPFAVGVLLAPMLIELLRRFKFGQEVRDLGPQSHKKKQGIPTMGGLLFILLLFTYTLAFKIWTFSSVYILASVGLFGALGVMDDTLKIKRKNSDGLSSKQKLVGQLLIASALTYLAYTKFGSYAVFPFWKTIDLGYFYLPIVAFMYVALTNAVNLTDGLDGLCSSVTTIVLLLIISIAALIGANDIYEMSVIMASSVLAFLFFNRYPAKVFMGDTGSFALGGFVAAASVTLGIELIIPIFGLLYVIESLSVIIQVTHYKRTKKRIFKMSPIHHHYELSGYTEVQVVRMFSMFTLFCCGVGFVAWYMAA